LTHLYVHTRKEIAKIFVAIQMFSGNIFLKMALISNLYLVMKREGMYLVSRIENSPKRELH
jgi:hypothetical protein